MSSIKLISVVGARPQFVKAAVLSRAIKAFNRQSKKLFLEDIIIHTGQHFDDNMNKVFFEEMSITEPKYNLNISSLSHGAMTGRMIEEIEKVLIKEGPAVVVLYGDTNSTLAGAIAAKKLLYKIVHIEAGLRSFNMIMPEEQNRILVDRISDVLFCPNKESFLTLKKENIENSPYKQKCHIVGDVMYDASLFYLKKALKNSDILKKLNAEKGFVLLTLHRQENTDDPEILKSLLESVNEIGIEKKVIFPVHPRTKKKIQQISVNTENIEMIDPVSYFDMILLEKNCDFIMTDSGGVQKEAYFFGKPCITLRNETEWKELVKAGINFIAGNHRKKILSVFRRLKSKKDFNFKTRFYGDGTAGEKIVEIIAKL
ncbi:MAG: hypothetical protein ACD_79C00120G0002 [uncultured bacterium]|nr:MAG: hypothetical protein ACD_79C00120G0002 [uncultured bacterium]